VTEKHPQRASLYSIKVEMDTPPQRAVHRYVVEDNTVYHAFFYEAPQNPEGTHDDIENYEVLLTTRRSLEAQAVVSGPMQIRVPPRSR
jgi:hypothetical protein